MLKPEKPEPKDIFEDFDPELFHKTKVPPPESPEPESIKEGPFHAYAGGLCNYAPILCDWVGTSRCDKSCERNPENFMDPKIKEVYDKEPWSNYCFNCGEFVPSRRHEDALDPPELIYSHTVATGYAEYKVKLRKWTMERLKGHSISIDQTDWKHQL